MPKAAAKQDPEKYSEAFAFLRDFTDYLDAVGKTRLDLCQRSVRLELINEFLKSREPVGEAAP
jgi:hypothetical protein